MRLIDVDALGVGRCSRDVLPADYCAGWNGVINIIDNAPTVDAVPVVRCKDCKYLTICNNKILYAICEKTGYEFKPFDTDTREHFCSYGEYKDKED